MGWKPTPGQKMVTQYVGTSGRTLKEAKAKARETFNYNPHISEQEMFEISFQRPSNFFSLSGEEQWEIDKKLGILDWKGEGLSEEDRERFAAHYKETK